MDDRSYIIILYDFYGELLTDKQREYFESYYFNNLSLSEISCNLGISRNAIHKSIKLIENKLYFYEDKLKLYNKSIVLKDLTKNLDEDIRKKIEELYQRLGVCMTNKKYKMYYDYKKRTSGGIIDTLFLSSVMITGLLLILTIIGGKQYGFHFRQICG